MVKRKVHIRDVEGNLLYNQLYDNGSVLVFASGFGFVTLYRCRVNHWQICEGWTE